MGDSETTVEQYEAMAAEYSAANDDGIFNSLYERPAMLSLLGDVRDQAVLDAGCGAGQLSSELVAMGATVTGVDVSPAMLEIAKQRLGGSASLRVADLTDPLPFVAASFDVVAASLVLHYIQDWPPVLAEFRRVLRPGGAVVLSTHHPTMDWKRFHTNDYFAKMQVTETWVKGGRPFDVTFWRRSLTEMSREVQAAGLRIDVIEEPTPLSPFDPADAEYHAYLTTHPHFILLRLSAATS